MSSLTGQAKTRLSIQPVRRLAIRLFPRNIRRLEFFRSLAWPIFNGTLLSLDGSLGRNAGVQPWTVFDDLRIAKRIYFGERFNTELIADMFNIANRLQRGRGQPALYQCRSGHGLLRPTAVSSLRLKLYW